MSLRLSSEDFSFSFKNFRTSWCRQNFKAFRLCHIHLILICRTFSYLSDNKLVKCDTTALCIEPPAGPVYGPCGADKEARTQLEISWRLSFYMKARKRLQKTAKGPSTFKRMKYIQMRCIHLLPSGVVIYLFAIIVSLSNFQLMTIVLRRFRWASHVLRLVNEILKTETTRLWSMHNLENTHWCDKVLVESFHSMKKSNKGEVYVPFTGRPLAHFVSDLCFHGVIFPSP